MIEHPVITRMEQYGELSPEEVYCHCDLCGHEIYVGDDLFDLDFKYICEACISRSRKIAGED